MKFMEIDGSLPLKDRVFNLTEQYPTSYANLLRFNKDFKSLADEILDAVPALASDYYKWSTRCYWILHDMLEFPVCENSQCRKPVIRNIYSLNAGYCQHGSGHVHCCAECARTDEHTFDVKRRNCMAKYGVDWYSKTSGYKEKCRDTRKSRTAEDPDFYKKASRKAVSTKIERFGGVWTDEMTEKSRVTRFINNGTAVHTTSDGNGRDDVVGGKYFSDSQLSGRRSTNIKRYGKAHFAQTTEYSEKSKKTCLAKYGVEYSFQSVNNRAKSEATNIERYGHKHAFAFGTDEFSENMFLKYGDRNYNNRGKAADTCRSRYGVPCYLTSDAFLSSLDIDDYRKSNFEKAILTKIRNNSFNRSAPEDALYDGLVAKFGEHDVVRQFSSGVYPFRCDFYIRSIGLYIEFNGTWMHGGKFYDENDPNDRELVEKWKDRSLAAKNDNGRKSAYDTAIYTWTQLDVRKAQTAIRNELRYLVFWTLDDAMSWLTDVDPVKMRIAYEGK